MGFPNDVLVTGEHVVVHTRPHPSMLVGPAIWFTLVVGAAVYLSAAIGVATWALVLTVVALALVGWLVVVPVLRWRTTHLVVTDRRVILREGIVTRAGVDLPLNRIDGIRFRQGPLERWVGCGTLAVESLSGETLEIEDVPEVVQVYGVLRSAAVAEPTSEPDE